MDYTFVIQHIIRETHNLYMILKKRKSKNLNVSTEFQYAANAFVVSVPVKVNIF